MRYKLHRPWTADDDAQLRAMAEANCSALKIAARLKRSARAVRGRAQKLGLPLETLGKMRHRLTR
ncbi:MAG: hypothetical protein JWL86_5436 [Rhizobium sp.]|nr:hypothetical protein [Rhizobium sp.]